MTAFLQRDVFRAMGTTCSIAVAIEHETAALASVASLAARREVAACERALSRFDMGSDLSRVNRESGSWVSVDERLVEALGTACRLRASTRGKFDPTILPALVAAGYDRSFERLTNRPAARLDGWRPGARIDVDAGSGLVRVERGAMIDVGGLGKGFAAARALDALRGRVAGGHGRARRPGRRHRDLGRPSRRWLLARGHRRSAISRPHGRHASACRWGSRHVRKRNAPFRP